MVWLDSLTWLWNWIRVQANIEWLLAVLALVSIVGSWIKRKVTQNSHIPPPSDTANNHLIKLLLEKISQQEQEQDLGANGQQLKQLEKDNAQLAKELATLKQKAVGTIVEQSEVPAYRQKALKAIQGMRIGDIASAQALLFELEQAALQASKPSEAMQLVFEQGALELGRNAHAAYQAFERAHDYDTSNLPTLGKLIELAKLSQGLPTAMRWANITLDLSEKLAATDPSNSDWQRDLSVSINKVAGVLEAQGERAKALQEYRKSLAIREKLAATDPSNSDWQRDLSVSINKVAGVLEAQGERAKALQEYRKSLAIREKLAATDSSNTMWQTDLVVGLMRLSGLTEQDEKRMLQRAESILLELQARNQLTQNQLDWIAIIQIKIQQHD